MKKLLFIFLIGFMANAQNVSYDTNFELEDYNFVLGTNNIAGKYQFTNESKLIEQSKHIRAMGSNILKVSLGKKSIKQYGLQQGKYKSTLELFKANPEFKQAFDMDFKYIFAWVHTATNINWKNRINEKEEKILYDEIFEFASYILKEYNNSGKTFLIGNWEGDWLLHPNFNRNFDVPQHHVDNMTKWFLIRQKAIDDAKKAVAYKNVEMYYYVEVNLVLKAMKGKTSISNNILHKVNPDLVSYSSYEAIKNRSYTEKKETLEEIFTFLEKQLQPKENIPFTRRVYLGEFGYHANKNKPASYAKQDRENKEIMLISLELNLPFSLHWQLYNNEYAKNGDSKEMSLINEAGIKRPLYYLHQNYYKQMNQYLIDFKHKNGSYPSQLEFNKVAFKTLQNLEL